MFNFMLNNMLIVFYVHNMKRTSFLNQNIISVFIFFKEMLKFSEDFLNRIKYC